MTKMRLFHRTNAAAAILASGFRDKTACYMTTDEHTGVWFSDVPLDENEGAKGDELLCLEIAEESIAEYEWVEEGKGYREWLIPATVANAHGPPRVVTKAEEIEVIDNWRRAHGWPGWPTESQ